MARLPGYATPDQTQHVILRVNNRAEISCTDADYSFYLEKLNTCDKHGCSVHAYMLIQPHLSAHYHSANDHRFLSDRDSYDYGYEWDMLAERSFGKHFLGALKWADYRADRNAMNLARNSASGQAFDLTRFWAYLQFSY